ncbi:hypothetical protein L9F63_016646 [Diploptera punctata]|uniref:Uncharacterized protein n=1 Tax=Diploptera punctata TaxID=6984 RepID=A0AAD8A0Q1_DIPPU|nr:hypothetical protein L9F63_016646 [Diploptera punctata]
MFNSAPSTSMTYRGAYSSKTDSPSPTVTEDDFDNNSSYEGSQREGSQDVDRKDIKLGDLIGMCMEMPKMQKNANVAENVLAAPL